MPSPLPSVPSLLLLSRPLFHSPVFQPRLFQFSFKTTPTTAPSFLSFFHPPHTHTHTHTRTFSVNRFTSAVKHHNNSTINSNNSRNNKINKNTMANVPTPTLPGFLRPEARTSRCYHQNQAFEGIESQEIDRLELAYGRNETLFSVREARLPNAVKLNRCKFIASVRVCRVDFISEIHISLCNRLLRLTHATLYLTTLCQSLISAI